MMGLVGLVGLVGVNLVLGSVGEAWARVGLLMTGDGCPDPVVAAALTEALRSRGQGPLAGERLAASVALVRARRALRAARDLYTRTNFAGCISLLSITEQELGRNLTHAEDGPLQRAHRRLAEVNLWLGVCQWAAGDPQAAAASFVRSAQLPSSPVPDGRLLPPELMRDYSRAVSAPREEVSCTLDAGLTAGDLLVNGKGPMVKGHTLRVPTGTHYMVVNRACPAGAPVSCRPRRRSMRLDGQPLGCRVPGPATLAVGPPAASVCISDQEGADAGFVAAVARQARVEGLLVTTLSRKGITLRYGLPARDDGFVRQVVSALPGDRSRTRSKVATVRRSIDLLLAQQHSPSAEGPTTPWYGKWWVWGVAGATVAALVVTSVAVAASSGNDRVNVVFDR